VIGELYEKAKEGFDVVFVSRTSRLDPTWYKIAQKMFYLVLNALSGMKFDSTRANFSIINSKVVNAFVKFSEQSRYFSSTIYWLGFNTTTINAKHGRRYSGKPSYTLGRRFKLARDIIISFSDRLLALASVLGLTSMIVGFVVISFILIILNESPEELIFRYFYILQMILTLVLLFLGSVVAIYLKEIFKETKSRPLYIIDKKVN
jgi:dolichol-phosphate mannosyltransferase